MVLLEYLKKSRSQKGITKLIMLSLENSNSAIAHDSENLSLIEAYNSIYKHYFI